MSTEDDLKDLKNQFSGSIFLPIWQMIDRILYERDTYKNALELERKNLLERDAQLLEALKPKSS